VTDKDQAPTLFPSFNARNLSAVDVARTFVPSEIFEKLCGQSHSLIVGPRGSGKTTLLKMLQQAALDAWQHHDAERIRQSVKFTGVYIPTDVNWDKQIAALGLGRVDERIRDCLSVAAFTTHVLRSFAQSIDEAIPVPSEQDALKRYSEAVTRISDEWQLDRPARSFQSLRYSMRSRLNDLHRFAGQLQFASKEEANTLVASTVWLHQNFLELSSFAIDVVNDLIGDTGKMWAFLFDELELIPANVREHLIACLRSTDQRILFKLSLVPYTDEMSQFVDSMQSATSGNDFVAIRLYYPKKEDASSFCRHLWHATLAELGQADKEPEAVLGESYFQSSSDDWSKTTSAYGSDSRIAERFNSLAQKDFTFANFLKNHDIDPSDMQSLDGGERPKVVRKAVSLVALRDALLRSVDERGNAKLKSKVKPELYTGAETLFAIVEGNPRWFKGLLGELIKKHGSKRKIDVKEQLQQIEIVSKRFRALLRTIPCPKVGRQSSPRGILLTLDQVGKAFHTSQVAGPFSLVPIGSFTIPNDVPADLLESLGRAVNAGGLIHMPGEDPVDLLSTLRTKRFRLSYLLAVHYKILLRAEREVSLNGLLENVPDENKPRLFDF
jgi:energy-coupling factor transporter ATP-binding protein EcfA2